MRAERKSGTFGDIGTFSTFFCHHLDDRGGVLTIDDSELKCQRAQSAAIMAGPDVPADAGIYEPTADDFYEAYRFILPGYNVRPQEINGAVGIEQLKKLPSMTPRGVKIKAFSNRFQSDDRFIIQRENGISSSFSFTVIPIRCMARIGQR